MKDTSDTVATVSAEGELRIRRAAALAAGIGGGLLSGGASVGAAEDAAERVLASYGESGAQVCAVPSSVTVCVWRGPYAFTCLRRVKGCGNDLYILESYGKLFRDICSGLELTAAERRLEALRAAKGASAIRQAAGGAAACGAFCSFFGGNLCDAAISAAIGFITSFMAAALSKRGAGGCARTFLLSAVGGTLSVLLCALSAAAGLESTCSLVMLGTIMTLIPGLALCNALRDVLAGDYFSGLYRILGGLAATAAIVAGYALAAAALSSVAVYGAFAPRTGIAALIIQYISCAAGAAGFCVMMNVKLKRLFSGVAAALLSYSVFLAASVCGGEFFGYFAAAVTACGCAAALSALYGIPAGVFLTPAVVPLLPGAALYYAVDALAGGDLQTALVYGWDALFIFACIAAGLAAAGVAARLLRGLAAVVRRRICK